MRLWPFHNPSCAKALYYGMAKDWDQACIACKARVLWRNYRAITHALRHMKHKI